MKTKLIKGGFFRGEPAAGRWNKVAVCSGPLDQPLTSLGSGSEPRARRASALIRVRFLRLRVKVVDVRGRSVWVHSSVTGGTNNTPQKNPKLN